MVPDRSPKQSSTEREQDAAAPVGETASADDTSGSLHELLRSLGENSDDFTNEQGCEELLASLSRVDRHRGAPKPRIVGGYELLESIGKVLKRPEPRPELPALQEAV